ncbi:SHOCT domain-containing protein [Candidatus Blastococcus massiliensis]|uniref:SHOCT domain-containing protein n=1 Tax=Candidatus Blastococcus massiliensis TaxID=1470358 RepID=UPI0004B56F75|nr:SHOCT domain-containing protein [Candidatus Blastococcus massiliensis]
MSRARGRARDGSSRLGTAARTAIIAGAVAVVSSRVARRMRLSPALQPAPPAASQASVDRLHVELTRLTELRDAGVLTDEDFAARKARLLAP